METASDLGRGADPDKDWVDERAGLGAGLVADLSLPIAVSTLLAVSRAVSRNSVRSGKSTEFM